ncbi:hypothetical protein N7449_005141 [Penicillium cf. viridicatum]|uniref:Uncharacterized protein n=1 Tax=Penicillium cf. viridicatum TaxID=2972119 RepID=A0A9W9MKX9_9EURO|nr:hypothetical protein N7449_005141 [Penicillium cf. viridicatum]
MVFDKKYRELNKLGWVPTFPWAINLIWDSDASKLGALLSVIVGLQLIEVVSGDEDVVDYGDEEEEEDRGETPVSMIWKWWGPLMIVGMKAIFLGGSSSPGVHFPTCITM